METINKEVEEWLDKTWIEKEKQLDFFAKNQRYDDSWNVNRVSVCLFCIICRKLKTLIFHIV